MNPVPGGRTVHELVREAARFGRADLALRACEILERDGYVTADGYDALEAERDKLFAALVAVNDTTNELEDRIEDLRVAARERL